jgi:hypothetical protein
MLTNLNEFKLQYRGGWIMISFFSSYILTRSCFLNEMQQLTVHRIILKALRLRYGAICLPFGLKYRMLIFVIDIYLPATGIAWEIRVAHIFQKLQYLVPVAWRIDYDQCLLHSYKEHCFPNKVQQLPVHRFVRKSFTRCGTVGTVQSAFLLD